jgi:two-component system, NtrC family, sensor kinase
MSDGVVKKFKDRFRRRGTLSKEDTQFLSSGRITTLNAIATCFAHQINNPLQIIQGSIRSLSKRIPAGEQSINDDLERIRNSANRIHELIQHLYRLVKQDTKDQEFLALKEVVVSAYTLFEKQLQNRGIKVVMEGFHDEHRTAFVYGNSVELEQVFINLFANARDALASRSQPQINVTLLQLASDGVTVRFADNGHGISDENKGRVFDSLFTTKPDGTGLGLWLCLSVIQHMNGTIKAESTIGQGTTFIICLPSKWEEYDKPASIGR